MDLLNAYDDSDNEESVEPESKTETKETTGFSLVHYGSDDDDEPNADDAESKNKSTGVVIIHMTPPSSPPRQIIEQNENPPTINTNANTETNDAEPNLTTTNEDKEQEDVEEKPNEAPVDEQEENVEAMQLQKEMEEKEIQAIANLDSFLPPKTTEPCNPNLRDKLAKFHELKRAGRSVLKNLQQSHAFKNPDIMEKLILFVGIHETGSNYPKELFDPFGYDPSDYYEELAKEQQSMYERREAERQKRTGVEFTKGQNTTSSTISNTQQSGSQRPVVQHIVSGKVVQPTSGNKKNKWDQQEVPSEITQQQGVSKGPASSSENSVISAAPVLSASYLASKGRSSSGSGKSSSKSAKSTTTKSEPVSAGANSSYADFVREKKREAELLAESERKKRR